MSYGYPTSRRFPRSMADAFADVRAPSVERHRAPLSGGEFVIRAAIVCAIVVPMLWHLMARWGA